MTQGAVTTFGLLEGRDCAYESSRAAILPVPFERTTSYGQGTARGPLAILEASAYLELWDEETHSEPFRQGIATLPPCEPDESDLGAALDQIRAAAKAPLTDGKFLVALGGEHSLTGATVAAAQEIYPDLGVIQFDAHADLRDEYEGSPYSHASVMKRLVDRGLPTLAVGLRSLSTPEAGLIRDRSLPVIWGLELDRPDLEVRFSELLSLLPETVFLTFDLDFFDPSLVPATGTPEPGGGFWNPTVRLLRRLFEEKWVVGMDVVELAPIQGQPASDFLAAKLVYKCLAYLQDTESRPAGA